MTTVDDSCSKIPHRSYRWLRGAEYAEEAAKTEGTGESVVQVFNTCSKQPGPRVQKSPPFLWGAAAFEHVFTWSCRPAIMLEGSPYLPRRQ